MAIRERTKYPGVYCRKAQDRQFKGKPDVAFDITYKHGLSVKGKQKKVWEKIGWLSEGYSEKLAADIRAERLRTIRHGQELPKEKKRAPYFRDAWDQYRVWAEKNKARDGRDDVSLYKNCLTESLADKRLNEISAFDLERLKTALLKKEYSPATVKHCLVLVRQIYNKMFAWGPYQGGNPVKGVKMPVLQNQRTRFLTYDEARQLLNELKKIKEPDLHDMALIALHCGLRAGEIFNLKGNDLDFQNEQIKITDPKNKTTRFAYLTASVKEILMRRKPESPEDLIFPDRNGKKIVAISQSFRKIINRLGFNKGVTDRRQKIVWHSLRHTFASWLAMQGESLLTIKELLGLKTTAMTERYSHLIPDHKRRAAALLENTFANGKSKVVTILTGKEP